MIFYARLLSDRWRDRMRLYLRFGESQKEAKGMTLHQWGLVIEIVGFIFIAFFVGVILAFKSELGVKPFLDRRKSTVARLSGRFTFLQWFNKNNAITLLLAGFGTLIYFVGMLLQACSTW